MNVFKEMVLSVYSYDSYSDFLKNKKGKVFGFGVLLVLIYFLITVLIPFMVSMGTPSAIQRALWENVPDFELKDGTLWVADVVELNSGGSYIYINTDPSFRLVDIEGIEETARAYMNVLIMDSEQMFIKSSTDMQAAYYDELGLEFTRDDLIQFIPMIYMIGVISVIFAYVWMVALFFFGVLFVALIGMMVASAMNFRITFGQLYLLGVYSRTLPLIIKAAVSFLPFNIPFFWVVNFGLSVFILAMAMRKMKEQQPQNPQNPQNPANFPPTGYPM